MSDKNKNPSGRPTDVRQEDPSRRHSHRMGFTDGLGFKELGFCCAPRSDLDNISSKLFAGSLGALRRLGFRGAPFPSLLSRPPFGWVLTNCLGFKECGFRCVLHSDLDNIFSKLSVGTLVVLRRLGFSGARVPSLLSRK